MRRKAASSAALSTASTAARQSALTFSAIDCGPADSAGVTGRPWQPARDHGPCLHIGPDTRTMASLRDSGYRKGQVRNGGVEVYA
jgi:hypothetical protein